MARDFNAGIKPNDNVLMQKLIHPDNRDLFNHYWFDWVSKNIVVNLNGQDLVNLCTQKNVIPINGQVGLSSNEISHILVPVMTVSLTTLP